MKKRHSDEQIIGAMKQQGASAKVSDLCREFESENGKAKRLLADKLLEVEAMKNALSKK